MTEELAAIIRLLKLQHGHDVSSFDSSFLARSVDKRRADGPARTMPDYLKRLEHDPEEAAALCASLHITYSEFFRSPLSFALLEQLILPDLMQQAEDDQRRGLRIWCAACAAGQEAWSVAILCDELAAARSHSVPCRIFATDVCEANLAAARRGVYDATAVQNVRLKHLHSCFTHTDDTYTVAARLGERIDFSVYDLLSAGTTCPEASIYGGFDLVLCCNVLFYYGREARQSILAKIRHCLNPKGYLVTGETERTIVDKAGGFRAVAAPATVFAKTE